MRRCAVARGSLQDAPLAWGLTHSLSLGSNDAWERLTKQYAKVDPHAVLPNLTKLVDEELTEAGAQQRYRNAACRLKTMRRLVASSDRAA